MRRAIRRGFSTAFVLSATALTLGIIVVSCLRPDSLAALILVPLWCWCVPGFIAAAGIWRLGLRRVASLLGLIWLLFGAFCAEESITVGRSVGDLLFRQSGAVDGEALTVVTLNCDSNSRCVEDLLPLGADVIFLQEAPGREKLAEMAQTLFGDAGKFLSGGDTAILTPHEMISISAVPGGTFTAATVTTPGGKKIVCVSVRLSPPVSRLDFWSVEFWREHREKRDRHRRELRTVVDQLIAAAEAAPLLIGGDFNTLPADPALDELRPLLTDAFPVAGRGWGATGTNAWPLFRVDQIWLGGSLNALKARALPTRWSDHRVVKCQISVPLR